MVNGMAKMIKQTGESNILHRGMRSFSSKGFVYTLEVLIAISMILISVVFILRSPPEKPDFSTSTMKLQGFDALEYMDNKGDLKNLVFQNNETEIENRIRDILPREILFETQLCNVSCSEVNTPVNETVVVINYYISGYTNNYLGKKVKLWLWRRS